jgi:hypothetical protein
MMHLVLSILFGVQVCWESTSLQLGYDLSDVVAHARVPEGTTVGSLICGCVGRVPACT